VYRLRGLGVCRTRHLDNGPALGLSAMGKGCIGQISMKTSALKECYTGCQHVVHKPWSIAGTAERVVTVNHMISSSGSPIGRTAQLLNVRWCANSTNSSEPTTSLISTRRSDLKYRLTPDGRPQMPGKYKVRRFRLIYEVDRKARLIRIFAIGHRLEVYEELADQLRETRRRKQSSLSKTNLSRKRPWALHEMRR